MRKGALRYPEPPNTWASRDCQAKPRRGKFRVAKMKQEERGELEARDPMGDSDLTPGVSSTGPGLGLESHCTLPSK